MLTESEPPTSEPAARGRKASHVVVQEALAGLAAGILVGVAWWWLTPVTRVESSASGVVVVNTLQEPRVAADGWFAICSLAAGAVLGILAALRRDGDRLVRLAGLVAGSLLGALVAWRLGLLLGDAPQRTAAADGTAAEFDAPLKLSALGVLLLWPMAAVALFFTGLAGFHPRADADRHAGAGPVTDRSGPSDHP